MDDHPSRRPERTELPQSHNDGAAQKDQGNDKSLSCSKKLSVGGRTRSELALTRMHSRQNQIFRALRLAMFLAG